MFALGGNPVVMEILEQDSAHIDRLLDIDSFPAEFRATNPKLQKYMDISKYETLVTYITELASPQQRLRAYKFPLVAAEILAIDNRNTQNALLKEDSTIIEETVTEERWIEKEVDECDSEFGSDSKSNRSLEDFFDEKEEKSKNQENIPPEEGKSEGRASIESRKSGSANKSGGSAGSRASITSDDFPFVEEKPKTIKVKKLITRKVEREIPPLLEKLCNYFKGELNHTLAGYICKVLEALLKKNPRRIVRQFFRNTDGANNKFCRLLLNHLQSQSVCELTINLLLVNQNQAEDARKQFLTHIVRQIATKNFDQPHDIFTLKNFTGILMEIVSKTELNKASWSRRLVFSIFEEPALEKLRQRCFEPKVTSNYKETIFIMFLAFLKKVFEPTKKSPPSPNSPEEEVDKQTLKKLLQLLELCFKGFIQKTWDTLRFFQEGSELLPSSVFIKELQISNLLVKQNFFWARTELVNQDETGKLLGSLCKKFANNNLLHNQIFELFKFLTHEIEECETLWIKIFDNKWFVFFCIEALSKPQVMYRGQCIYLCQAIKNSKSETIRKFKLLHDQKWHRVEELLHQDSEKINQFLGGFGKKSQEPLMMFEKEAILEYFGPFLKGQILQKEQSENDEQVEDLTSSRGSTEWNDWNQFSNYNADEVVDE